MPPVAASADSRIVRPSRRSHSSTSAVESSGRPPGRPSTSSISRSTSAGSTDEPRPAGRSLDHRAVLLAAHRPDEHLARRQLLREGRLLRTSAVEVGSQGEHDRGGPRHGGADQRLEERRPCRGVVDAREHLLELVDDHAAGACPRAAPRRRRRSGSCPAGSRDRCDSSRAANTTRSSSRIGSAPGPEDHAHPARRRRGRPPRSRARARLGPPTTCRCPTGRRPRGSACSARRATISDTRRSRPKKTSASLTPNVARPTNGQASAGLDEAERRRRRAVAHRGPDERRQRGPARPATGPGAGSRPRAPAGCATGRGPAPPRAPVGCPGRSRAPPPGCRCGRAPPSAGRGCPRPADARGREPPARPRPRPRRRGGGRRRSGPASS